MDAKPKPMSVDQKSFDLADHFMADVKGHTAAHVRELAEAIQTACEDHCSMAEADISPPTSKSDAQRAFEKAMAPRENPLHPMFRDHNCWKCRDGVLPCKHGYSRQCEFPHARND